MNAYRPLALISLAFGMGAYTAYVVHMGTIYTPLLAVASLLVCVLLFALGSFALGSRRKMFIRGSSAIALVYGAVTYVLAFLAVGVVYHLATAPSPTLSFITLSVMAFISGALFVSLFARKANEAS
jgi:hypothetical protein